MSAHNNEGYGAGGEVLGAEGLGGDGLGQRGGEAVTPTTATQTTTAAVTQQAAAGGVTATGAKVGFSSKDTLTGDTRTKNDDDSLIDDDVESVNDNNSSLMEIDPNNITSNSTTNPNLKDITFVDLPDNISNLDVIKDNRKRPTGSQRRFNKKQKQEDRTPSKFGREVDIVYTKKPTYATLVKSTEMIEVRADDLAIQLAEEDYHELDVQLLLRYADYDGVHFDFELLGNYANGGVWFACANKETAAFLKENIPKITPPEEMLQYQKYCYKPYEQDSKPFRFMRGRVPKRFYNTRVTLTKLISICNKVLRTPIVTDEGIEKLPHFNVVHGCEDRANDIVDDFFEVGLEIDEKLFPKLIDMKGQLMISSGYIKLYGGGMVSAAKQKIKDDIEKDIANKAAARLALMEVGDNNDDE